MEQGSHDCISQLKDYLSNKPNRNGAAVEELKEKLEFRQVQQQNLKNKFDEMNRKNKNLTLKLAQQYEQAVKQNKSVKLDLKTIPDGIDPEKYQFIRDQEEEAK